MPDELELPAVPNLPAETGPSYYEALARHERKPREPSDDESPTRAEFPGERDARRMAERMPAGYKPYSGAELSFDPRIAYEIALGMDKASVIFGKYGVSEERAVQLVRTPAFLATVRRYGDEIREGGVSFKLKAKIQSEDLLSHSYMIATDPEAPMSVRADLIKWTAKMAGFEPALDKGQGGAVGGFVLNISFAGDRPVTTIEGEVTDV